MNESLRDIICCPLTHQPLRRADSGLLERVNGAIDEGALKDARGRPVAQRLEEALVTRDGARLYPVRDGMPALLASESIVLQDRD